MSIPRVLREQLKVYEREGFHAIAVEPRSGSHFKVVFAEFSEPQILTKNAGDPRALKNNIARFRKLAREQGEKV